MQFSTANKTDGFFLDFSFSTFSPYYIYTGCMLTADRTMHSVNTAFKNNTGRKLLRLLTVM